MPLTGEISPSTATIWKILFLTKPVAEVSPATDSLPTAATT